MCVGIWKPAVERKKCHFNPDTDNHQNKTHFNGNRLHQQITDKQSGKIGHVKRAGLDIEVADPEKIEAGSNSTHYNILKRGKVGAALAACQQGITCQG